MKPKLFLEDEKWLLEIGRKYKIRWSDIYSSLHCAALKNAKEYYNTAPEKRDEFMKDITFKYIGKRAIYSPKIKLIIDNEKEIAFIRMKSIIETIIVKEFNKW